MSSQESEGLRKALRNEASILWSMPSLKTPGLKRVSGSALKKSKCLAVTIDGTKSTRSAKSISYLDCASSIVLDPSDLPVRVRLIQVMECWRIVGSIFVNTRSKNQGVKDLKVNGQYSRVFAFCLPRM